MMNRLPSKYRLILVLLLLALLLQSAPGSPNRSIQPAEAYDFAGAMSNLIPFAGVFKAFKVRNKVYREANAYIDDQKEYYDRLQEKARERLRNRQFAGENRSQVGAYVKVSVLIAQERQTSLEFAELKKQAAREEFLDKFEKAILHRVINSGAAQRLIRAMSTGIRAAQGRLDTVLDHLSGEEGGFLGELAQVRRQAARMQALAGAIGGRDGRRISGAMGRLVGRIDQTTGTFSGPISEVNDQLGDLADMVESLERSNLVPRGIETPNDFVIRLIDGSQEDPVLDAILGILDDRSGSDDGTIREQARQKILTGFIIRCARTGSQFQETLARLESDAPADEDEERDVSLCQAIAQLLEQEEGGQPAAESEGAEEEEAVEEPGAPYLNILSVETSDGWCFPANETNENEICSYTIEWEVEYSAPSAPAGLVCHIIGVDYYESDTYYGQYVSTVSGTWNHSMTAGGFYPELGNYTEHFYCEMYVPDLEGEFVTRADTDIVAPLTTVRED